MMPKKYMPDNVRPRSGQVTLGASGTFTYFPDFPCQRALFVAHPSNAGDAWVGNCTGTLSGNTGFPLTVNGPGLPLEGLENLNQVIVVADVIGDKVCWVILDHAPTIT